MSDILPVGTKLYSVNDTWRTAFGRKVMTRTIEGVVYRVVVDDPEGRPYPCEIAPEDIGTKYFLSEAEAKAAAIKKLNDDYSEEMNKINSATSSPPPAPSSPTSEATE